MCSDKIAIDKATEFLESLKVATGNYYVKILSSKQNHIYEGEIMYEIEFELSENENLGFHIELSIDENGKISDHPKAISWRNWKK